MKIAILNSAGVVTSLVDAVPQGASNENLAVAGDSIVIGNVFDRENQTFMSERESVLLGLEKIDKKRIRALSDLGLSIPGAVGRLSVLEAEAVSLRALL